MPAHFSLYWAEVQTSMHRKNDCQVAVSVTLSDNDLKMLRLLSQLAGEANEPVVVTANSAALELELSAATVRRTWRALSEQGLITMTERWRDDGSRSGNSFELTRLGREAVLQMRPNADA